MKKTTKLLALLMTLVMLLSISLSGCGAAPQETEPADAAVSDTGDQLQDTGDQIDDVQNDADQDLQDDTADDQVSDDQVSDDQGSDVASDDNASFREPQLPAIDEDAAYNSADGDGQPQGEMIEHTLDDGLLESEEQGVDADNDFNANSSLANNRAWHNLGTCTTLDGDTQVIILFVDDYESKWDDASIVDFYTNQVFPGLQFIVNKAVYYQVDLSFNIAYYSSTPNTNFYLKYNGYVGNNLETSHSSDVLRQAATAIGFDSVEEMYESCCQWAGVEKVAFMVAMNKYGRSYAMVDTSSDNYDFVEYCVIFNSPQDAGPYGLVPATVAHETLHLYGAEDYYLETTTRHLLADQICYYDIMRRIYTDISYNHIGAYTAYSVGWRSVMPQEYNRADWFT